MSQRMWCVPGGGFPPCTFRRSHVDVGTRARTHTGTLPFSDPESLAPKWDKFAQKTLCTKCAQKWMVHFLVRFVQLLLFSMSPYLGPQNGHVPNLPGVPPASPPRLGHSREVYLFAKSAAAWATSGWVHWNLLFPKHMGNRIGREL